ncbi:MAG TPA: hypothetical protein VJS66_05390, partial [Burkholderiales bacterium]|nr:hypothetical protein [Burkholderiales bacterium]
SAFTYMLVNAVKELSAQNAEQGKRLAYLAEQNETQSQKLAELMAQNKLMMSMIEKRLGAQSVAFTK